MLPKAAGFFSSLLKNDGLSGVEKKITTDPSASSGYGCVNELDVQSRLSGDTSTGRDLKPRGILEILSNQRRKNKMQDQYQQINKALYY